MKSLRIIILLHVLIIPASLLMGEDAPARFYFSGGKQLDLYIVEHKEKTISYKRSTIDSQIQRINKQDVLSIYFYEPRLFSEAIKLYHARKFAQAKNMFKKCEDAYKSSVGLPNNYSTRAEFYKIECSRRLMDFSSLKKELKQFSKSDLTNEVHLQQIEIYSFWNSLYLREWERLDELAKAWQERKVTPNQRAQIAYCHAVALDNLAKQDHALLQQALNTYNTVLTADAMKSSELVTKALTKALDIYNSMPEVRQAKKNWKTKEENKNSPGYQFLIEASSLAQIYKNCGLEQYQALKADYVSLLKYKEAQ